MEDLQKMMIVALIYRLLVCFYEIICIWGAGGATPGKFLLGLRVVTCDTSVLIAPSRVLVIPSSNVSMTTSTIRALIKNFSIASFFPAFITLLFFQHNRTAYDIVAGTIVVRRNGVRWYQKMRFPDWFWTSPPTPCEHRPTPKLKSRCLSGSFAQMKWELIRKLKKVFYYGMMPAATFKVLEFS